MGNFVDNIDNRVLAPAPAADSLFAGTRDKKWNIASVLTPDSGAQPVQCLHTGGWVERSLHLQTL